MICSRRRLVVTIGGASYDVDVDVPNDSHENTLKILFQLFPFYQVLIRSLDN
jgi:hypothetical protein